MQSHEALGASGLSSAAHMVTLGPRFWFLWRQERHLSGDASEQVISSITNLACLPPWPHPSGPWDSVLEPDPG